jgi:hypothetical protein
MVDMISTDSLGIAAPFLCHIIEMAALPSQQTTRRMSQQLLSKCDPGKVNPASRSAYISFSEDDLPLT